MIPSLHGTNMFRELPKNQISSFISLGWFCSLANKNMLILFLAVPITWIDAPQNQYATLGQRDARITCIVQANPAAMVDWQRDREPIRTGYGGNRFRIVGEGIIISGVEEGDEGAYTCRARVAQTGQLEERIINFSVNGFSYPQCT